MIGQVILLTSFLGSILVIAPTFKRVERYLTDTEKINALQEARHKLLEFDRVTTEDIGFEQVRDVFSSRSMGRDWETVSGFYPLRFGAYGGGGGWIYLLNDSEINADNPLSDGSADSFESILITDEWIRDEINQLQTQPKQKVRAGGFSLLVLSVVLQALATAL